MITEYGGVILVFVSVSGTLYSILNVVRRVLPSSLDEWDSVLFNIFYRYHPPGEPVNRYLRYFADLLEKNGMKFMTPQSILILREVGFITLFLIFTPVLGTFLSLLFATAFFIYPDVKLRNRLEKRKEEIRRDFPYFVDLLALVVESGVDINSAMEKISKTFVEGSLKEEIEQMVSLLKKGMRRRDLLKWWSDKWKIDEIEIFSSIIIQAEETGASLGKTLRELAEKVREERFAEVERKASQLPVRLLFPLFLIFASVMLVIAGILVAQIWGVL